MGWGDAVENQPNEWACGRYRMVKSLRRIALVVAVATALSKVAGLVRQ